MKLFRRLHQLSILVTGQFDEQNNIFVPKVVGHTDFCEYCVSQHCSCVIYHRGLDLSAQELGISVVVMEKDLG